MSELSVMAIFENGSAKERLGAAYLAALRDHPEKITVSQLIADAHVNRSTFYRNFEDLAALQSYVSDTLIAAVTALDMPVTNAEEVEAYSKAMFARAMEDLEFGRLMCGKNGERREYIYMLALAMKEKLSEAAKNCDVTDPDLLVSIEHSTQYYSAVLFEAMYPAAERDDAQQLSAFVYNIKQSLPENIARWITQMYGGSEEIHYDLYLALVKTTGQIPMEKLKVADLMRAAGYSRTQFYLYYRDIDDFLQKINSAFVSTIIAWTRQIIVEPDTLLQKNLDRMIDSNYSFLTAALFHFFSSGDVANYYSAILDGAVRNVALLFHEKSGRDLLPNELQLITFNAIRFSSAMSAYFMEGRDYALLRPEIERMRDGLRSLELG